jgi:hypothetical protein
MSGGLAAETGSSDGASSEEAQPFDDAPAFDTSVAHSARVYDYWLGRKLQVL